MKIEITINGSNPFKKAKIKSMTSRASDSIKSVFNMVRSKRLVLVDASARGTKKATKK